MGKVNALLMTRGSRPAFMEALSNSSGLHPGPCARAAPDQADNPGLMRDCINLLPLEDTLRGSASLNWSVDTAITRWDGVTVADAPKRVTMLDLSSHSLTGTIPSPPR
jgi:hypothetical protein